MSTLVGVLQQAIRRDSKGRTVTKERSRRWMHGWNKAMPVLLDTAGTMLLSGSVMLVNVAAGVAAIGVGLIVLNWRFYGR